MDDPYQLSKEAGHCQAALTQSTQRYYKELREVELQKTNEQNERDAPFKAKLKELQDKYAKKAFELALAAEEVPYATWGGHEDPYRTLVSSEGIVMLWDVNPDGAYHTYIAKWADLVK